MSADYKTSRQTNLTCPDCQQKMLKYHEERAMGRIDEYWKCTNLNCGCGRVLRYEENPNHSIGKTPVGEDKLAIEKLFQEILIHKDPDNYEGRKEVINYAGSEGSISAADQSTED